MAIRRGFQFSLSDEEIMKYLLNKVTGSRSLALRCDDYIHTADLYGSKEPWEVFEDWDVKERYFFTKVKKAGKRMCRNVGKGGVWSNKGQKTWIHGRKGGIKGYKRSFRYESRKCQNLNSDSDSDWLLKEYLLPDYVLRGVKEKYADYALCVLKRRRKKKKGGSEYSSPIEEELSAAVEINDDWLHQQLGVDHLIDDDDDDDALCVDKDRAAVVTAECSSLQEEYGWRHDVAEAEDDDDHRVLIDDDVPCVDKNRAAVVTAELPLRLIDQDSSSSSLHEVDGWIVAEDDDGLLPNLIVTEDHECSTPRSSFEGQKGGHTDFNFGFCPAPNDHLAWDDDDLFGDYRFPWAGIQQMLPVPVV